MIILLHVGRGRCELFGAHRREYSVCLHRFPSCSELRCIISGPPLGVPKFVKLSARLNRGLHTEWWILREQTTAHCQLLVWGLDHESTAFLWCKPRDI